MLAGGANTVFGFSLFTGLYYLLIPYSVHYTQILLISQVIAITCAFLVYRIFVFKSTRNNPFFEYVRFVLVYGVALLLNMVLIVALVDFGKLNAIIAQGFSTLLIILLSYFSHRKLTFRVG